MLERGAKEPVNNPYSLNEYANVLYIDQPAGSGFSYGQNPVDSSEAAAYYLYKVLQAFLAGFQEYDGREVGIFGASYVGHTGPSLAAEILANNAAIKDGFQDGSYVNLTAVCLQNPWLDIRIQERSNIEYAFKNTHRTLINQTLYDSLLHDYSMIEPQEASCEESGAHDACFRAYVEHLIWIEQPINESAYRLDKGWNVYDVRKDSDVPLWPHVARQSSTARYLGRKDVQKALGIENTNFVLSGHEGGQQVRRTGDFARSVMPKLSAMLDAGVEVVMLAGDADYICNWFGVQAVVDALEYEGHDDFREKKLESYTVGGRQKGTYKKVGNLGFVRVFNASHSVGRNEPETLLQIVKQTMMGNLTST